MRYFLRPLLLTFLSSLLPFCVSAAEDDDNELCTPNTPYGQTLNLPQLIDIALMNNPETSIAWWRAKQAAAVVGQAKSAYYPKLYGGAGIRNGRDYIFLTGGPQKTFVEMDVWATLSYVLFDWGERNAAVDAARAALCEAEWNYDQKMQTIFFRVTERAYDLWKSHEILDSQQQTLRDYGITLAAAEELYRAGLKSITDIYAAKTSYTDARIAIIDQEAAADIANSSLVVSMGFTPDVHQSVVLAKLEDPTSHLISKQELASLMELANQRRADLQAKRAQVGSLQALARKAFRSSWPKLKTEATTAWRKYIKDHAHTNGYNYLVGLSLEVPIFDGFYYTNKTCEAEAAAEAAIEDLYSLELAVALDVLVASRYVDAAQDIFGLAKERLDYAIKTYEGTLEKYKIGTQSIFELIDAQQRLAAARVKYSEAKFRWYLSVAALANATGTLGSLTQLSEESCYTVTTTN